MLTFTIFGKNFTASSYAEASSIFSAKRDASGRGSSTMPLPPIELDGVVVAHFSYNGKIWEKPSRDWKPGMEPIYSPYAVN